LKQDYIVRAFREGDEEPILRLFEKAYENYGGYTQKNVALWRWCCLQKPGVEKAGVLVALDGRLDKLVGYVVAGRDGSVWELAYDPDCDGEAVVSLLLEKTKVYLEDAGASSIALTAPKNDVATKRVCEKMGFTINEPPSMFLSILDYPGFISLLANYKGEILSRKFNEVFLIKLKDPPSWVSGEICLQVNRDGIKINDNPEKSTIMIYLDHVIFSSIVFGLKSPFRTLLSSEVKIRPVTKTLTGLRFLSNIRIDAEWSYPLSEYG
jgi:ribosomal protein S18 acetylase RimI-like enzyme